MQLRTGLTSATSPPDVFTVSVGAVLFLATRAEERVVRVEVLPASDAASSVRLRCSKSSLLGGSWDKSHPDLRWHCSERRWCAQWPHVGGEDQEARSTRLRENASHMRHVNRSSSQSQRLHSVGRLPLSSFTTYRIEPTARCT